MVRAAMARGVVFELCYAPVLREPTARRQMVSNALAVVRATGGAGVIISSGANRAFELRGPPDVTNLSVLFGLQPAAAKDALSTRPDAVLKRARQRRSASSGILMCSLAEHSDRDAVPDDAAHAWPPPPATLLPCLQPAVAPGGADEPDGFLAL